MHCGGPSPPGRATGRPRLEVADIFRVHGEAFRRAHVLTPHQRQVFDAIVSCRTAVLGGHLDLCQSCGHERPSYNSCRDRHCPKCQALPQARWLEGRRPRILPTHYFHVVFTLPAELRALALGNRKLLFDMLFDAASSSLLDLGRDPARLGARLGITAVLHTWARDLGWHPHVHCVVTGGGLAPGGDRWVAAPRGYLFPVKALSALFRGKLLAALRRAYDNGRLVLGGRCEGLRDPAAFGRLVDRLHRKDWVVYAKKPFGGADKVFEYLGRYTHRVAISNSRLLAMDEASVTFLTRDGKTATVAPQEFIRRFLLHLLPKRFVKIRHFGLMAASNATTKLEIARSLLEADLDHHELVDDSGTTALRDARDWKELLRLLTGIDLSVCPRCGSDRIVRRPIEPLALDPITVEPEDTS